MSSKHFELITLGGIALRCARGDDTELATRRRKLALLAVLALSRRPPTRDALVEMFWGDEDDSRARHSLSDALSHLRRTLGRSTIATRREVVELNAAGTLAVDAIAFEAACESGDVAAAITRYGGAFLDGVYVEGSQTFEEWVSRRRNRYALLFANACEARCTELYRSGSYAAWLEVFEQWSTKGDPLVGAQVDNRLRSAAAEVMERLARARVASIESTAASQSALTLASTPTPTSSLISSPAPESLADPVASASAPTARMRFWRRHLRSSIAASVVALALGSSLIALRGKRGGAEVMAARPIIAMTDVQTDAADSSVAWLRDGFAHMIAADLERLPAAEVVAPSVVRDVSIRAGLTSRLTAEQNLDLARRVHASIAVAASIAHVEGSYLVDVVLRDVGDGSVSQQFTVTGSDILAVADQVAVSIISSASAAGSGPRLSDVETASVAAYRHYIDAERLRGEGRFADADRELDAAIAADSGFTSAIVARMHASGSDGYARMKPLFDRAQSRLTEWDRMTEAVYQAMHLGEHARAEALGRALVARFPRDPRALNTLGWVYLNHARFASADSVFTRLLALDSLALLAGSGFCAPCDAFSGLAAVKRLEGNFSGDSAVVAQWLKVQPGVAGPWLAMGDLLAQEGRFDAAQSAFVRARSLGASVDLDVGLAHLFIMARRYDAADSIAGVLEKSNRSEARDVRQAVLRERGQLAAAARVLDSARRDGLDLVYAHLLGQAGDDRRAREIIEASATHPTRPSKAPGAMRADDARAFAWEHAVEADAIWTHADTTLLRALADSIEQIGATSYYARDWQLSHHVRGLIAERGQRWDEAERELTQGSALIHGWTRTALELARVQLARSNPTGAIATLRGAYREPPDAMGRYVPRSELDFEMSLAFARAGQEDSARRYAAYVRSAWKHADPQVARRLVDLH